VLQLVLLVGGLFVLGLLCGERAGAAERTGDETPPPAASRDAAPRAASTVLPSAVPSVRDLVRTVTEDVTRTVGQTVSGALAEVRKQLPTASVPPVTAPASPGTPNWPGVQVPGLPDVPAAELPGLPDLPDHPGLPDHADLPGFPDHPDLPGFPDLPDVPDGPGLPEPPASEEADPAHKPAPEEPADHGDGVGRITAGPTGAYSPWGDPRGAQPLAADDRTGADRTASRVMDTVAAQPGARFGYGPVRQGPSDQPAGVPGNRSSGDNNGPRCADAHAVSVECGRVPVRLVPGAAVRAEADETRDRHGDVPVSPA